MVERVDSMDASFSSQHEAEGGNVATYYFRHESATESDDCEESRQSSSDEGMGRSLATLRYSKEDIRALASQAEQMVLGRMDRQRAGGGQEGADSDYASTANLHQQSEPCLKRRPSPRRRALHQRRRDWRNSLPECLEYFHRPATSSPAKQRPALGPSSDSQLSDSDGTSGAGGRLSAPELSELWEEEQCLEEEPAWSEGGPGGGELPGLLSFGEDYGRYLRTNHGGEDCLSGSSSDGEGGAGGRGGRRRRGGAGRRRSVRAEGGAEGDTVQGVRGRLEVMARDLQELGRGPRDPAALVWSLKQEVSLVYRSLKSLEAALPSPAPSAGAAAEGPAGRWWSWGLASSLLLLSLVSLGSLLAACLTPRCCSDPGASWAVLSSPAFTFSYVNGPPPM
jgi:hypothetical protein